MGCIVMKPRWAEVEKEYPWLHTQYYDVDENKELAIKLGIENYPCFIFLDNKGVELTRLTGEVEKKEIIRIIEKYKER